MKKKLLEMSIPFETDNIVANSMEATSNTLIKTISDPCITNVCVNLEKIEALGRLFNADSAPEEPKRRPRFVVDFTKPVPAHVRTAAGQFGLAAFATYADHVEFTYIDKMSRELRLNSIVVGVSGDGKRCVKVLCDAIMYLIDEEDQQGWKTDKEYRKKKEAAGDRKTDERPDVLIRILKTDITEPELNQLGDVCDDKPFFMHVQEPDELDLLKGGPRGRKHFKILKKADDEHNSAGQMRVGVKSVSSSYNLRLNYVIEIRPTELLSFYAGEIINGARDRASLCEIPEQPLGADIPTFGDIGEKYRESIRPYIDRIRSAKGTIKCPQAIKLIKKLKSEIDEYTSGETLDKVLDKMSHRALCRAFRRACLCFIANGQKWDPALNEWIRWSFLYDLWLQYHYFADAVRSANGELKVTSRGPVSFRNMLPIEFDFEQLRELYAKVGYNGDDKNLHGLIRSWIDRGNVERTEKGYRKLK